MADYNSQIKNPEPEDAGAREVTAIGQTCPGPVREVKGT
jgi:hypothetical protein